MAIQCIAISSHDQLLVNNGKGLLFAGFTLFGTFLKFYVQVRALCMQLFCKQPGTLIMLTEADFHRLCSLTRLTLLIHNLAQNCISTALIAFAAGL